MRSLSNRHRPDGLRNARTKILTALILAGIAAGTIPTASAESGDAPWDTAIHYNITDAGAGVPSLQVNSPNARRAATLTRASRANAYDDFLRIVWVSPGSPVTSIGKPTAKRVFFTASSFFDPAPTVDQLVNFVGNYYHAGKDLAVMVCRPTAEGRARVEPLLATWPNLLPVIKNELGDCSASTLTPGEQQICEAAERYRDRKYGVYAYGLRKTLDIAEQMFRTTDSQNALWDDFGIATAFTGLGFAVWGSSTPANTVRLSGADILRHSVVPEYVLKNATLQEANCHCVQVPESEELHQRRVDPAVVWELGALNEQGACRELPATESLSASP